MTIEEKARRYDEALERAKNCLKDGTITQVAIDYIETIFPELAESEDERIRKSLINFIDNANKCGENPMYEYGIYPEEILAWLEKQGEKPQGKTALEAINEEIVDNANKVEPKFKVGDWINGYYTNYKVLSVNNKGYVVEDVYGNKINILFENEKFHHLWTIQDAKDGDVLVDEDVNVIGIFEGIEGMCWHSKFYYSNTTKEFYGIDCGGSHQKNFAKPATKEQRDLLFAKMKEAGYMWDAEKKELKIKLKEPDVYEYELERIVDKLNEVIGKLGDIHQVLSKPYVFPYRDYTPPSSVPGMDVWYKTHGVDKVPPVTCETTNEFNKSEDNENK